MRTPPLLRYRRSQHGFTLVEMIMVIVITGIIGGIVAVFLKAPVQQYMDVARRADMTDIADTALRRIERDLRLALPNSVRVDATGQFIEFLPTTGGGRYRDGIGTGASAGCGSLVLDVLDFSAADTCFEVLGAMPTNPAVGVGNRIVVYNLGITGADAYASLNSRVVSAVGAATISITSTGVALPFDSPSHRFQMITTPVSYVCVPVANGVGGTLTRYWGYAIQAGQPTTVAILNGLAGVQSAVLANNVSACSFAYNAFVVAQRSGLVTMNLGLTESGETVALYSATHVSNVP